MHAFIDSFIFFPDIVATNGDWSTEDTIWFSERVVNSQFVTKILDVIYDPLDDNVRISVSLIDTTHPTTDIYIEKQLVEDKRAVYLCVWFMYNSVRAGYDLCTTVYQDMKKSVHCQGRFLYDFLSEKYIWGYFLSSKNHSMIKPILIKSKKHQTKDYSIKHHTDNVWNHQSWKFCTLRLSLQE